MKKWLLFLLLAAGCTVSVTKTHTEGSSTATLDEDQTTETKVDPTVQIPLDKVAPVPGAIE